MYTTTITKVEQDGSIFIVGVQFSKGKKTEEVVFNSVIDLQHLKYLARKQIEAWDKIESTKTSIQVGQLDLTPEEVPVYVPTTLEQKKKEYAVSVEKLKELKKLIELGALTDTDEKYTTCANEVKLKYNELTTM